jgi:hypothetical protein
VRLGRAGEVEVPHVVTAFSPGGVAGVVPPPSELGLAVHDGDHLDALCRPSPTATMAAGTGQIWVTSSRPVSRTWTRGSISGQVRDGRAALSTLAASAMSRPPSSARKPPYQIRSRQLLGELINAIHPSSIPVRRVTSQVRKCADGRAIVMGEGSVTLLTARRAADVTAAVQSASPGTRQALAWRALLRASGSMTTVRTPRSFGRGHRDRRSARRRCPLRPATATAVRQRNWPVNSR